MTMRAKANILGRFMVVTEVSDLRELTNAVFNDWVADLTERGVSPRSINTYNAAVMAMVRYYRGIGMEIPLQLSLVGKLREGAVRRRFYTRDEVETAISHAEFETGYSYEEFLNEFRSGERGVVSFTYNGVHECFAALPNMRDRTILLNGFSKAYAMTGWRLGYVCGPKPLLSQMVKIHQYGIMSAPTTSQYAAIEALKNGDEDIETMRKSYDSRRKLMLKRLREIGLECFEPKGAFYMFPSIKSTGLTSDEFCTRFLKEEKVAVIPGTAFGDCGEGYVRMCYAVSVENIEKAMSRMGDFIKRLK